MAKEERPWIDANGNQVSEEDLRKETGTWGASTWEDFLKSTVESPLLETLTASETIDTFANRYREAYQEMLSHAEHPHLEVLVRSLVKRLTSREREVVHAIFWQGLSQHEVAQRLKVARSVVRNCRDRALRKLGVLFVERVLPRSVIDEDLEIWTKRPIIASNNEAAS